MGINNIPPKICSYACVYCQLGRTDQLQAKRQSYYDPVELLHAVETKVAEVQDRGEEISYLTFVPDGEPTLDVNLSAEITALKPLGIPIAVISNASLLSEEQVRADLAHADWVSLKVDAVDELIWREVNRPHGGLSLEAILDGMRTFAGMYHGVLLTETMLIADINDGEGSLDAVASFLGEINPMAAYIGVPTRPPAEPWVRPAPESRVHRAFQLFNDRLKRVELLLGYEGNAFASSGDGARDLISITAVHPMRRDAVEQLLARNGESWAVVEELLRQEKLVELSYRGKTFYLRRIAGAEPGG